MTTLWYKSLGYNATRDEDGTLTIHRVPIFVECKRGEVEFNAAWLGEAVTKAKQAEAEGYYPPLHIRHHGIPSPEANDAIRAAGYFRVLGTEVIVFKGARRLAVMADLVVTRTDVQEDILAKRLPYRSVEIFDVEDPALASLALLDHEAPFLELPMLAVVNLDDRTVPEPADVAYATISNPWNKGACETLDPVAACFKRGSYAHLVFREVKAMPKTIVPPGTPTPAPAVPKGQKFADGDGGPPKKDKDKDGEDLQNEGGLDVKALVKAIEDGTIPVADMEAIEQAIQARKTATPEGPEGAPAPAASPGAGEAMGKPGDPVAMAALQGRMDATEARLNERDALDKRKGDVATAMVRLANRPLGSDLEGKLVTFHEKHGAEAFAAYVDSMAQTFGAIPSDGDGAAERFVGQAAGAPAAAMVYQEHGTEAVEKATSFSRQWKELHSNGFTRMSEKRYVQINMAKEGFEVASKE